MDNMDDFIAKVLAVFPGAEVGEDNDGQLVVYTNLTEDSEGHIVKIEDSGFQPEIDHAHEQALKQGFDPEQFANDMDTFHQAKEDQ